MIPSDATDDTWSKFKFLVATMIHDSVVPLSKEQLEFVMKNQDVATIV